MKIQHWGWALIAALIVLLATSDVRARDPSQVRAFRRDHPCPITGQTRGPCVRGTTRMVVDHLRPLCGGGADHPLNMRWQEYRASRAKDARELAACRCLDRARRSRGACWALCPDCLVLPDPQRTTS